MLILIFPVFLRSIWVCINSLFCGQFFFLQGNQGLLKACCFGCPGQARFLPGICKNRNSLCIREPGCVQLFFLEFFFPSGANRPIQGYSTNQVLLHFFPIPFQTQPKKFGTARRPWSRLTNYCWVLKTIAVPAINKTAVESE